MFVWVCGGESKFSETLWPKDLSLDLCFVNCARNKHFNNLQIESQSSCKSVIHKLKPKVNLTQRVQQYLNQTIWGAPYISLEARGSEGEEEGWF